LLLLLLLRISMISSSSLCGLLVLLVSIVLPLDGSVVIFISISIFISVSIAIVRSFDDEMDARPLPTLVRLLVIPLVDRSVRLAVRLLRLRRVGVPMARNGLRGILLLRLLPLALLLEVEVELDVAAGSMGSVANADADDAVARAGFRFAVLGLPSTSTSRATTL
jgi:hypothetical protein